MTKIRNYPRPAHVFGVHTGKTLFHVVGLGRDGGILQKAKFRRQTVLQFFERAEPTIVGMEACPGSQWLARKLLALGHDVRIVPAKFVKPYVKSNKNDLIDAEAIAEAVSRPTMRFVEVKTEEQVDGQALHRIRQQFVSQRTRLICQMRAFCLEYGVALRPGVGCFKIDLPAAINSADNDLYQTMRRLLSDLFRDLDSLERRIAQVTAEIEASASSDERIQCLMTIPGIGPLGESALVAAVGDAKQFHKARDMFSWLGIVPRQATTGGKPTLLGISKRGNSYLRKLIIHGARSCLMHLDGTRDRLGVWLDTWRRGSIATRSPSRSPISWFGLLV